MKTIAFFMILSLVSPSLALAVGNKYSLGFEGKLAPDQGQSTISEFVYQNGPDEILIKVFLLGAVSKPGLYHVPVNTDLFSLLAFAGGPLEQAELDHIQVKHRPANAESKTSELDLQSAVTDPNIKLPTLALNDVILVPQRKPAISNNTIATVGVVATVLGIILTGVLVGQTFKK